MTFSGGWPQRIAEVSALLVMVVAGFTALAWLLARPPLSWLVKAARWWWTRTVAVVWRTTVSGPIGGFLHRIIVGAVQPSLDRGEARMERIEADVQAVRATQEADAADRRKRQGELDDHLSEAKHRDERLDGHEVRLDGHEERIGSLEEWWRGS